MTTKTLIAIPTFNSEKFVERTLLSAVNQTVDVDVILFDNCSTDKTISIAKKLQKKYNQIEIIVHDKNYGRTGNWNQILDYFEDSQYDYLKYLFSGDELLPGCIEEVEKMYLLDPKIGAVAFPYYFVHTDGSIDVADNKYSCDRLFSEEEVTKLNLVNGSILGAIIGNVYARKYLNKLRFNESYLGKADFDIFYCANCKFFFASTILAKFHAEARNHFSGSVVSWVDLEFSYIQMRSLDRLKDRFTAKEILRLQKEILLKAVQKQLKHFNIFFILRLFINLILYYPTLILTKLKSFLSRTLSTENKALLFKVKNNLRKK